jgi:hypothetical protein
LGLVFVVKGSLLQGLKPNWAEPCKGLFPKQRCHKERVGVTGQELCQGELGKLPEGITPLTPTESATLHDMSLLHVMSLLGIWAPRLLLMSLELWLLTQSFPIPKRAQDLVQLTSEAPGPTEPWSLHSWDLLPDSPEKLTPPANQGGL